MFMWVFLLKALGLPCHPDQEDVVVSNPFMQLNQISNSGNDEALEMLQVRAR